MSPSPTATSLWAAPRLPHHLRADLLPSMPMWRLLDYALVSTLPSSALCIPVWPRRRARRGSSEARSSAGSSSSSSNSGVSASRQPPLLQLQPGVPRGVLPDNQGGSAGSRCVCELHLCASRIHDACMLDPCLCLHRCACTLAGPRVAPCKGKFRSWGFLLTQHVSNSIISIPTWACGCGAKRSSVFFGLTEPLYVCKSPRREVVRSSAGASVVYPAPLFWGRSHSIPQCMVSDV